jgi:hypothetical protein
VGTLATVVLAIGLVGGPGPASEPADASAAAVEPEASVPELVSPGAEAVVLEWDAPGSCPDAAAVRRALAGYLGEAPSAEAGAAVRAVARVSERGGGYRLSLRTETPSGVTTRQTTASDCTVLVDATAVIVAIAVDPSTMLARGAAAPEPVAVEPAVEPGPVEPEPEPVAAEPVAESAAEPVVEPAVEPVPPTPPEPRVRFGMRVGGGVDVGVLPGLAGGVRLAGAAFGRGWRAELRGDSWFPRTTIVQDGIGGRVSLVSLGARGCGVPAVARVGLEFPLCAGLEAGAMRGDPVGDRIASPQSSRRPWLAADASAGLAWAPRRFIALVLQAELVVPILRAGFRVGEVEVHRVGPVAGRGLLGLEARFP